MRDRKCDRAGNMTTIPLPASTNPVNPYPAVYDAWNRLVSVPAYSQSYRYDGLHRRITSGTGTSQRHYYYSASWQVLEERLGANPDAAPPERQFVWGLRYLDDCVLRDRSPTNNGVLSERLYALQDANWNVTCLVDPAGAPVERYTYRAYGAPWFYSGTFVPRAFGGLYQWETLYAGYRFDLFTGLYQVRYRYLHPGLGCWLTRDPSGRFAPPALYLYVRSNPTGWLDTWGLTEESSGPSYVEDSREAGQYLACGRIAHVQIGSRFAIDDSFIDDTITNILNDTIQNPDCCESRKRPDVFVHHGGRDGSLYEIKPDNPWSEARGLAQVKGYQEILNACGMNASLGVGHPASNGLALGVPLCGDYLVWCQPAPGLVLYRFRRSLPEQYLEQLGYALIAIGVVGLVTVSTGGTGTASVAGTASSGAVGVGSAAAAPAAVGTPLGIAASLTPVRLVPRGRCGQ